MRNNNNNNFMYLYTPPRSLVQARQKSEKRRSDRLMCLDKPVLDKKWGGVYNTVESNNKSPDKVHCNRSQNDTMALKKCCSIGDIQSESLPWVSWASAGTSTSSSGSPNRPGG